MRGKAGGCTCGGMGFGWGSTLLLLNTPRSWHQLSTATVSDRAGEQLTEDIMHEGEARDFGDGSDEGSGSGRRGPAAEAADPFAAPAQQPQEALRGAAARGRGADAV